MHFGTFRANSFYTDLMHQLISLNTENRTMQDLDSLVHRLTRHLSCLQESHLPIGKASTEMLRQCNLAGVNPSELKRTKSNYVNCNSSVDALNKILFCQQLIKSNKQLDSTMIQNLQHAEPIYNTNKTKIISGQGDPNFKIINKTRFGFSWVTAWFNLPFFALSSLLLSFE